MKKQLTILTLTLGMLLNTGCVSYMEYESNKTQATRDYVYRSGDPSLIQSYNSGDVTGVGIDIVGLDAVFHSPSTVLKQTGAAIADGGIVWLIAELVSDFNDSGSDGDSSAGRDNVNITVSGNGNDASFENSPGSF